MNTDECTYMPAVTVENLPTADEFYKIHETETLRSYLKSMKTEAALGKESAIIINLGGTSISEYGKKKLLEKGYDIDVIVYENYASTGVTRYTVYVSWRSRKTENGAYTERTLRDRG
jgi:hypothetical protein